MSKKPSLNNQNAHSQTRATWIASVVAIIVSLFSLYEAHEARVSTVRDEVILRARRPSEDQQVNIRKSVGEMHFGDVAAPWELLLANTGNSTISVTEYEVMQIAGEHGQIAYSGLNRGLFSPENNKSMSLPIVLEAGKSIRLLAVVGIAPGKRAYAAIAEAVQGDQGSQPRIVIDKTLAKKGIDLFDNPVAPLVSDGVVSGWRVEQTGKEQVFLFKLKTARGATAFDVSSWYDLKRE